MGNDRPVVGRAGVRATPESASIAVDEASIDGTVVDEHTVPVVAGETRTVEFTHAFDERGEFSIGADATTVGTVTVQESPADGPTTATDPGSSTATATDVPTTSEGANGRGPTPGDDGSRWPGPISTAVVLVGAVGALGLWVRARS